MILLISFQLFLSFLALQAVEAALPSSSDANVKASPLPSSVGSGTPVNINGLVDGTLSSKQIRQFAMISAQMIQQVHLDMFKKAFDEFAPDSWCEALDIPLVTIRCLIRESTIIALEMQQAMVQQAKAALQNAKNGNGTSKMAAKDQAADEGDDNDDYYGTSDNSTSSQGHMPVLNANGTYSSEQICEILQSKCRRGFVYISALNRAINDTLNEMPPHVLQILQEYSQRFKGISEQLQNGNLTEAKSIAIEFYMDLKSITTEEREQMAELFPKLGAVITDPRIDQLLDLLVNCSLIPSIQCDLKMSKLASDIWKSAKMNSTAAASFAGKMSTTIAPILVISRNKRDANSIPAGDDENLAMPDVNKETDDDEEMAPNSGIVVYSPNGAPLNLFQMDGSAPDVQTLGSGIYTQ